MSDAGDLLRGKRVLVTGVLTTSSIGFHVARICLEQGAEVVLTGYGRISLVRRVARRLPSEPPVLELDITDPAQVDGLADRVARHLDALDGIVHSIAFAPQGALSGAFLSTDWCEAAQTLHTSAYSLKALSAALLPLMRPGSGVVALDFGGGRTFPEYDWMGVAKSGLASTARYLARYLGEHRVRVNLVSAGPLRTMAGGGVSGQSDLEGVWSGAAPLGWDYGDPEPVARAVAMLISDWFPATTGENIHVDGGFHSVGI